MRKLAFVFLFLLSPVSRAEQFPAKGRLLIGSISGNPSELNTEMTTQGINKFETITKAGVDITYAATSFMDLGLRYEHVMQKNLEATQTNSNFNANLTQDAVMGVARFPLMKSEFTRFDVFGAAGVGNTNFSILNASQDGQLTTNGYKTFCGEVGASVGIGYKNVFFLIEGGYESNKVGSLETANNINGNVKSIDMSGSYLMIGLMFDGITATK